jgi:DNA/RNA-binding domain of Phe-tRNA-synthetase-like protein
MTSDFGVLDMYKLCFDEGIKSRFPGYGAVILYVSNFQLKDEAVVELVLDSYTKSTMSCIGLSEDTLLENEVILGWRETYKNFSVKPRSAVCTIESLLKRVLVEGKLPSINPVVDLYNLVSAKYLIPIGGEDRDRLASNLIFREAIAGDTFVESEKGDVTFPAVGEPVWVDEEGVTCRRWNWRQCFRTRIRRDTKNMYFVLDALPGVDVSEAVADLILLLGEVSMPGMVITQESVRF